MLYTDEQYFWTHVIGFGNIADDFYQVDEGTFCKLFTLKVCSP